MQRYKNYLRFQKIAVCISEWFRFSLLFGRRFLGKEVISRVLRQIEDFGYVHPVAVIQFIAICVSVAAVLDPSVYECVQAPYANIGLNGGAEVTCQQGFGYALHNCQD